MTSNLYNTQAWRKARAAFLKEHPLCVYCQQQGKVTPATVVDHIIPHKGDERLFWDRDNWAPLCARCHNSAKAIEEHKGVAPGCGKDGMPLDPKHPWRI
jgi:5-methylcytosine-specific restriction endonuclease McrA